MVHVKVHVFSFDSGTMGVSLRHFSFLYSYKILASKAMEEQEAERKAAGVCLEAIALPTENYRLGNTKVLLICFIFTIACLETISPMRNQDDPGTLG